MTFSDSHSELTAKELGDCIECTSGYKRKDGYYHFVNGKVAGESLVHRWIYRTQVGELSSDEIVRHICDNPWCGNPKHLIKGMPIDNVRDMHTRKRYGYPNRRLTQAQVDEIRRRARRETYVALAKEFNISESYVSRLLNKEYWR